MEFQLVKNDRKVQISKYQIISLLNTDKTTTNKQYKMQPGVRKHNKRNKEM